MTRRKSLYRPLGWLILVAVLALAFTGARGAISDALFNLTGEESALLATQGPHRPLGRPPAAAPRPGAGSAGQVRKPQPLRRQRLPERGSGAGQARADGAAGEGGRIPLAAAGVPLAGHRDPRQGRLRGPAQPAGQVRVGEVRPDRRPGREVRHGADRPRQHAAHRGRGRRATRSAPSRRPTTTRTSAISSTQLVNRYKGRIRYYQLWNEPNIYPEWGNYPISPRTTPGC